MHNLTPHIHSDHVDAKEVISGVEDESIAILDWMQRMFAQDLGEGHLEHCVTVDNGNDTDINWVLDLPCFIPNHTQILEDIDLPTGLKLKPPLIAHPVSTTSFIHLPLRAPPVCA